MKILFVNKFYPPEFVGGAEAILSSLAVEFARQGHQVHVATTAQGPKPVEERVDGVPVTRLPLRNVYRPNASDQHSALQRLAWHVLDSHNPFMSAALDSLVSRVRPDVISFHNLSGWSAGVWPVASKHKIAAVQVLHDYYHLCPRSQMFRHGKLCLEPCTDCRAFRVGRRDAAARLQGVIGVSRAVLDSHLQNGLFDTVPIRSVVHNARSFSVTPRADYRPSATRFGFIGTLGAWKGVRPLLESFRRVSQQPGGEALELLVAGTGQADYFDALKTEFSSPRVRFLGATRAEEFYEQVDVIVVPSIWNDPFPTVIVEALLSGVPVIGARRGGISEMIVDGVNGVLFDPDQPASLDDAILRLAREPGLLPSYGAAALASAKPYADLERMVNQHCDVYERAQHYV